MIKYAGGITEFWKLVGFIALIISKKGISIVERT